MVQSCKWNESFCNLLQTLIYTQHGLVRKMVSPKRTRYAKTLKTVSTHRFASKFIIKPFCFCKFAMKYCDDSTALHIIWSQWLSLTNYTLTQSGKVPPLTSSSSSGGRCSRSQYPSLSSAFPRYVRAASLPGVSIAATSSRLHEQECFHGTETEPDYLLQSNGRTTLTAGRGSWQSTGIRASVARPPRAEEDGGGVSEAVMTTTPPQKHATRWRRSWSTAVWRILPLPAEEPALAARTVLLAARYSWLHSTPPRAAHFYWLIFITSCYQRFFFLGSHAMNVCRALLSQHTQHICCDVRALNLHYANND